MPWDRTNRLDRIEMSTPVRLRPEDAERYVRLRRRMLADAPWAFSANPRDSPTLDPAYVRERLTREDNAIYGIRAEADANMEGSENAEAGGSPLVAVAGIVRGTPPKFSHRCRIWACSSNLPTGARGSAGPS